MKLLEHKATYFGANPFSDEPVLVMELRLAEELVPRVDLLCQALRNEYPDWLTQPPDASASPATRMALTVAQWALAALNVEQGFLHAAGATSSSTGTQLWVGFHEAAVSQAALQLALATLLHADRLHEQRERTKHALESLCQMCRQHHPNEQSMILMQAARANRIPVMRYAMGRSTWQFGWGQRSRVFSGAASNENGSVGQQIASTKTDSKIVFAALGLPVPVHCLVMKSSDLEQSVRITGWPCVTKPVNTGRGKGVMAGIRNLGELEAGFAYAKRYTQGPVMVEAFIPGDDHRLMVVDGRLIAVIRRELPFVEGNGKSTVSELVGALNTSRASDKTTGRHLLQIQVDAVLHQQLARQSVTLDTVPVAGRRITLRSNANLSTGGIPFDVTGKVHHQIRKAAEMIAQSLGLHTMGLDYITTDISRSWEETGGGFIETNPNPSLPLPIVAGYDAIRLGEQILGEVPGRIPLTLAVVPQAAIPAVQGWLQQLERPVGSGWVCGEIGNVDGVPLRFAADNSWHAAAAVLRHRSVGVALIVCGDQDLMRQGLHGGRADLVLLCNVELPLPWQEVLSRNAGQVDQLPHWKGLASRFTCAGALRPDGSEERQSGN